MKETYNPNNNSGAGGAYSDNRVSGSYHQMMVGLGVLTQKFNQRRLRLSKKLGLLEESVN